MDDDTDFARLWKEFCQELTRQVPLNLIDIPAQAIQEALSSAYPDVEDRNMSEQQFLGMFLARSHPEGFFSFNGPHVAFSGVFLYGDKASMFAPRA